MGLWFIRGGFIRAGLCSVLEGWYWRAGVGGLVLEDCCVCPCAAAALRSCAPLGAKCLHLSTHYKQFLCWNASVGHKLERAFIRVVRNDRSLPNSLTALLFALTPKFRDMDYIYSLTGGSARAVRSLSQRLWPGPGLDPLQVQQQQQHHAGTVHDHHPVHSPAGGSDAHLNAQSVRVRGSYARLPHAHGAGSGSNPAPSAVSSGLVGAG